MSGTLTRDFCTRCFLHKWVTHRDTFGKKTGSSLDVCLWDTAMRLLRNRLRTLEQGLDRDRLYEWELPPEEWRKLLRNTVPIRRRGKGR